MADQTRRNFLKSAAAGAAAMPLAGQLFAAGEPAGFKYSMCNETFGEWRQEEIFAFLGKCGYEGVEIAPFTINTDVTKVSSRERSSLRSHAERAGIRVVALHWLLAKTTGLHLTSPDKATREKTAQYLAELGKFCADLGGDTIVFGSPKQRNLLEGVGREEGMKYAVEVLRGAMPVLQKRGVTLALEPLAPNETNFMTTAAEGVELARRVDHPNCKLLLDCKAMFPEPTPISELIRRHHEWLVHFHANDPNLRGPGMGELDFVPIFEALRDVQFSGWISVEVFDYTPGPETLARESLAYMHKVELQVRG